MLFSRKVYNVFLAIKNLLNRRRLKVHEFSIITNSCIGAVIYHKLGVKYQSPFINCGFSDADFVKLVRNLKVYMEQKLCFVEIDGVSYPTAYLGDILIHFVHYSSRKEAEELWEERKKGLGMINCILSCQIAQVIINSKRLQLRNEIALREYIGYTYLIIFQKLLLSGDYDELFEQDGIDINIIDIL